MKIYRYVDGKLVEIPERDPKHRYYTLADGKQIGGGSILVEMTDAEEALRDKEEAEFAAEQKKVKHNG